MTREEFMKHAESEIEQAFRGQKNRMMNLAEQAWAEGKRNAEIDGVTSIVKGVLDKLSEENKEETDAHYHFNCINCGKDWWTYDAFPSVCPFCQEKLI